MNAVPRAAASRISGASAGRLGDERVAKRARHLVARAVAAGLRQRSSARCEHDRRAPRAARATCRARTPRPLRATAWTRVPVASCTPLSADAAQQRVEHVAGPVGIGKQLAAGLFVQRHAELAEERDGLGRPESPAARAGRWSACRPRSPSRSTTVLVTLQRAPPLTRILAPGPGGAVQQDDVQGGTLAPREDRRSQPGRAGADDGDVVRHSLKTSTAAAYTCGRLSPSLFWQV